MSEPDTAWFRAEGSPARYTVSETLAPPPRERRFRGLTFALVSLGLIGATLAGSWALAQNDALPHWTGTAPLDPIETTQAPSTPAAPPAAPAPVQPETAAVPVGALQEAPKPAQAATVALPAVVPQTAPVPSVAAAPLASSRVEPSPAAAPTPRPAVKNTVGRSALPSTLRIVETPAETTPVQAPESTSPASEPSTGAD